MRLYFWVYLYCESSFRSTCIYPRALELFLSCRAKEDFDNPDNSLRSFNFWTCVVTQIKALRIFASISPSQVLRDRRIALAFLSFKIERTGRKRRRRALFQPENENNENKDGMTSHQRSVLTESPSSPPPKSGRLKDQIEANNTALKKNNMDQSNNKKQLPRESHRIWTPSFLFSILFSMIHFSSFQCETGCRMTMKLWSISLWGRRSL